MKFLNPSELSVLFLIINTDSLYYAMPCSLLRSKSGVKLPKGLRGVCAKMLNKCDLQPRVLKAGHCTWCGCPDDLHFGACIFPPLDPKHLILDKSDFIITKK